MIDATLSSLGETLAAVRVGDRLGAIRGLFEFLKKIKELVGDIDLVAVGDFLRDLIAGLQEIGILQRATRKSSAVAALSVEEQAIVGSEAEALQLDIAKLIALVQLILSLLGRFRAP